MSTLEAAISVSVILIFLTFLVTGPESLALDALDEAVDGVHETRYFLDEDGLMDSRVIDGTHVYNTSPEKLNTYLAGISDTYRMLYGMVAGSGD